MEVLSHSPLARGEGDWRRRDAGASSAPMLRQWSADARGDLAVLADDVAQVAAEAILVHLFAARRIPQPASVGRELVAQHDRAARVVERVAELELVVDQVDPGVREHRLQYRVDLVRHRLHLRDLFGARPAQDLSLIHISEPTRQAEISYAVF